MTDKVLSASRTRQFTDGWCERFKAKFGASYVFQGVKDGAAVKRLLNCNNDPHEMLLLAERAWMQTNQSTHWACVNQSSEIAKFASAINTIRAELAKPSTIKPAVAVEDDGNGAPW